MSNETNNINNMDKRSEESKLNNLHSNAQIEFKHFDTKPLEFSQNNTNVYDEEIIIKEINANFRVDEIMEPIYDNLMFDKKEYDRMKFENDKKEMYLGNLIRNFEEIGIKEDFDNLRKKIKELKENITIEKDRLFAVSCQSNSLLYMLNIRKQDLVIRKQPVIKELVLASNVTQKTEYGMNDLSSKVHTLNEIYVFISLNLN